MPKAYKQHRRRASSRRKRNPRVGCSFFSGTIVLLIILLAGWWMIEHPRHPPGVYDRNYPVIGNPSINADFINQVLDAYHSPAHGKGQALYDDGVKYGIDPVFALAFFLQESRFGTTGVARVTLSLGNIRTTSGYEDYDGYRKYQSWEDGFEDWYHLIKVQYIEQWNLVTVDQIIPVYAPSSDNNDVEAYIQAVKQAVDTWRNGEVKV